MKNLKKYFTLLNIVLGLEVLAVFLAAAGVIPREAVLVWTALALIYMVWAPVRDSLWLLMASIPLFVAMPISYNFDSMANWRILIAVLFLCLLFKQGISLHFEKGRIKESLRHYWLDYLALIFVILSLLSMIAAAYKGLAFKKVLFFVNIFLLFLVARNIMRSKEEVIRIWQALSFGGIIVIAAGLFQFLAAFFVTLLDFWRFWADKFITVFYGRSLADLLSYSNSWFAYYDGAPPTLRLFSVFPDSHSFAMFSMLILPVFAGLAIYYRGTKKPIFYWALACLALFGIVFSGSRGAWLSAIPVVVVALYFYFKDLEKAMVKKILAGAFAFILLFAAFSGYPPFYYKIQTWTTGQFSSSTYSFFERARSISDLDETSNKSRLQIWKASVESIAKKPILGVGLGNYFSILDEEPAAAKKGASAHNLYLDLASEIGILGAVLIAAMFLTALRSAWLVFKKAGEPHFKMYALVFGLAIIWIAGYSLFDVVFFNDKVFLAFMGTAASLYALRNIILDPDRLLPAPIPFFKKRK